MSGDVDAAWRQCVFPHGYRNPTPAARYNLVVIGAGPAGLVTAIVAAGLGARVALIERQAMGGDCLNVGCVPSKTLLAASAQGASFDEAMRRVRAVRAQIAQNDSVERYSRAGVDVFLGAARMTGAREIAVGAVTLHTRRTVIATGAHAAVPPIAGLAQTAPLSNETVFDLALQPRRLAILGAGPVGCELAQAFARLGSTVDLMELQERVLPDESVDATRLISQALAADGVRLHLGARISRIACEATRRLIEMESGARLEVDQILVATGRVPNVAGLGLAEAGVRFNLRTGIEVDARLRTSNRDIYAAGDVCSRHQFTHAADAQARIVVRNALFRGRARADRLVIPRAVYTQPELAQAGATRAQLERSGCACDSYRCEFGELDRGRTDAAADGYAEVLTARGTGRILGATIVARDAGEQLAPILIMMTQGIGLDRLGSLVLPYPTRCEYLRRIADAYSRTRLTARAASTLRWWLNHTR